MKTSMVLALFGSKTLVAEAVGVSPQAVCSWGEDVPKTRIKALQMAMREKAAKLDCEAAELRAFAGQ